MAEESVEALIGKRFIARQDVKAVQHADGSYAPDRTKFTMSDLRDHVAGRKTFGHYMLNQENVCKYFCFDLDLDKEGKWQRPPVPMTDESGPSGDWADIRPREAWVERDPVVYADLLVQLRTMAEGLALRVKRLLNDLPVAIAYSGGKGMHVYGFTGPEQAAAVRRAAHVVLEDKSGRNTFSKFKGENFWKHDVPDGFHSNITIEVFPKQNTLEGKDLGNLMRLPLGVHRRTNENYFFIDPNSPYDQLVPADPFETLTNGSVWR